MTISIAVSTQHPQLTSSAQALATELKLPFADNPHDFEFILIVTPHYVGIMKTGTKMLPVYVNFLTGKMAYRRQHTSLHHEALARALGLAHYEKPVIVDATAGLARDSFILASLGFEIQLVERSPILSALLKDGLERAMTDSATAPIVNRLHLIQTNSISWLPTLAPQADLIYLDPMFPERDKSALVKKEMRILQEILGPDLDGELLLETALTCATKRVVVKRPRLAEPVKGITPSYSVKGRTSRFDVYLK